ncbi:MAG TPA: alpha/beta hydrolase [Crinalium sp.]
MTTIYFATNRKPNRPNNPDDFGSEFSADGLANLRFGKAEVSGPNLTQIEIEVAPENLDPAQPLLGSDIIFNEVQEKSRQGGLDIVIFIHGFNVSFKDGLQCAAKLERKLTEPNPLDTGTPPKLMVVMFSWPSDASLLLSSASRSKAVIAYGSDRTDAEASGTAFARAFLKLVNFINETNDDVRCDQRLHLVAHSMGNYVLRHALQAMRKQLNSQLPRVFNQILMLAADEDDDTFDYDYKLMYLPHLTRRTSVYFNRGDLALWASDTFKGNPSRLGTDGPLRPQQLPRNIYSIDCTEAVAATVKPAEHGYFISSSRVVADMRRMLRGEIPDEIPGRKYIPETNRYRLLLDANAAPQR